MSALVLWLHDVRKPGNLGAALRLVVAADATLCLTAPGAPERAPGAWFAHTRARHAAAGHAAGPADPRSALDRVVAPGDFDDGVAWARERGLTLVGSSPRASRDHWSHDLRPPTALVIGNEVAGLSDRHLAALDAAVQVPMPGPAESLNAVSAASVLMWEALRQRA